MITGIMLANLEIWERSQREPRFKGMGTTCVAMYFLDDTLIIGHVGDSRCYRARGTELTQLTEDHSLINDYIRMKRVTPEEAENWPHKNVIVRALGMKESVQVDILTEKPHVGDTYLLCSDGLTGMLKDDTDPAHPDDRARSRPRRRSADRRRPTRRAASTTSPSCSPASRRRDVRVAVARARRCSRRRASEAASRSTAARQVADDARDRGQARRRTRARPTSSSVCACAAPGAREAVRAREGAARGDRGSASRSRRTPTRSPTSCCRRTRACARPSRSASSRRRSCRRSAARSYGRRSVRPRWPRSPSRRAHTTRARDVALDARTVADDRVADRR